MISNLALMLSSFKNGFKKLKVGKAGKTSVYQIFKIVLHSPTYTYRSVTVRSEFGGFSYGSGSVRPNPKNLGSVVH